MNEIAARLDVLERHLATLLADNADLRARNASLQQRVEQLEAPRSPLVTSGDQPGGDSVGPESPPVSRRGMIAAVAGVAGGMLLAQATPAAAANGGNVLLGNNNTATSTTQVSTSAGYALQGVSSSSYGVGVYGYATPATGITYGAYGRSNSSSGYGVYGEAKATTGTTFGVVGFAASPAGFALYGSGRAKVTGRSYLATPASGPVDADLDPGSVSLYLDTASHALKARVKYPNGTLKTATIALI